MQNALSRLGTHNFTINTVIDIGASNGKWSLKAMPFLQNSSFLAIEPLLERQSALDALKKSHPNFDYLLCAAGEKDNAKTTMTITEDLDGSTIDGQQSGETRTIPLKTLDTIIHEKKLNGPFLLKFDTHGYETPILQGARRTLAHTNLVVMEVYNFKITDHTLLFYEMCHHMATLGFRCYDMADPMHREFDNTFWQMDLFFCRADHPIFNHNQYC